MPIQRVPVDRLLPEAWDLRHPLRLADALYVVLTRAVRGELLTSDARLTRAPGLGIPIVLLS